MVIIAAGVKNRAVMMLSSNVCSHPCIEGNHS